MDAVLENEPQASDDLEFHELHDEGEAEGADVSNSRVSDLLKRPY